MLKVIRDNDGNILGCCEYYIVDKNGILDDNGIYIWINEVEIAKNQEGKGLLKEFAKLLMDATPQARFGYFHRKRKYPQRGVRMYSRRRWTNLVGGLNV